MRQTDNEAISAALLLAKRGKPIREACELAGISHMTLYNSEQYKKWSAEGKPMDGPRPGGISAKTVRARALIEEGLSVTDAARKAGISHTTIYRSAWYRERKAC